MSIVTAPAHAFNGLNWFIADVAEARHNRERFDAIEADARARFNAANPPEGAEYSAAEEPAALPEGLDDPTTWTTTDGWFDGWADRFAAMGSDVARHAARVMRETAAEYRFFDALTPAEFDARRLAWNEMEARS